MTYATDRNTVAELQRAFLERGGEVKKCPTHATGTGNIRYNFAKRRHSATHDYIVWAETCDTRTRFSMRVDRVADVQAAMDAFQAVYEDANIVQVHKVR